MAETMIERVARNIYECRNGFGCKPWVHQPLSHRDAYLKDARVAIAAMREPSDDMKAVSVTAGTEYPMREWWRAMIDAALKD
jgi:hypothetical protein